MMTLNIGTRVLHIPSRNVGRVVQVLQNGVRIQCDNGADYTCMIGELLWEGML